MIARMRQRRDTAAGWTSANPTLGNGEFGYETDTGKLKVGDGSTAWASLAYWTGGSAVAAHKTSHATGGSDAIAAADIGASPASHAALTTTAHGGIVASGDSRLTDSRTPTAHAASHKTGGSDALAAADIGAEPAQTAASQAEMEAGTEAGIRSVSPLRVAQAIAALGGGLSGTGAVDNAVLRADGTGGETLQSSDLSIEDAATATQANVALTNQHAGQTNSALVLTPKGTGALIIGPKPDGTATGGNARGASATDLTALHDAATDVASGWAATRIGIKAVASAEGAIALGGLYMRAAATGPDALAAAAGTASGSYTVAIAGIATYNSAKALGGTAESAGQIALGFGGGSSVLTQTSLYFCRATSSSTDATVVPVNGNFGDQAPIPASSVIVIEARICGWQTGGKVGYGSVRAIIERTGTTTRLVAGPTVVAAWAGDAELGTPTLAIAVDDTTERWQVVVTPANTTATEWGAVVESLIDYRT